MKNNYSLISLISQWFEFLQDNFIQKSIDSLMQSHTAEGIAV